MKLTTNVWVAGMIVLASSGCGAGSPPGRATNGSVELAFGAQWQVGISANHPSTPFLRYAPDGRLFAVWTEDHEMAPPPEKGSAGHHRMAGDRAPSPMRNALIAWTEDNGKTWSSRRRLNSEIEAVQEGENGPKIAFDAGNRAFAVWSIPGAKGDKTRANIRFAMEDAKGGFTPARTLNEVQDAARFPIIEATPDGNFLIAWIDRRIDNPKPRQLYVMKIGADGTELTKNHQVAEGLCECCKLGVAFADGGKMVYLVDREVDGAKVRNHVLRKSTDGAATFGRAVEISNDGWQVPSCPHSGPSIGRDGRGWLHVSWFTLGRSEKEAGIYYSVSKDGGESFAPRRLVHGNTAPEILYNSLAVGDGDAVYLAWTNLDGAGRAQIYMRTLAAGVENWSAVQQVSNARGNASRPVLALRNNHLHVAWTETDNEESRVILRTAAVRR